MGDTANGGDVAIAAVVAPPRVRKFTEVEVQVFVRSFGFEGKRSEVLLEEVGADGRPTRTLASLPITLQSGFQSVSLSFRTDLATRKLRVSIPPLADEVSEPNNRLDTEMAIDRTKIRVLYVEGSSQPITTVRVGDRTQYRGPFSDLKQALSDDEDIECVVLVSPGGVGELVRIAEYAQVDGVRGFPTTVAELAAFDAIILSDVAAEAFTETQLEWIEQWIGQRGGGLCMVGGEHSFASGGWDQTPLAAMLPVEMLPGGADWVPGETVRIAPGAARLAASAVEPGGRRQAEPADRRRVSADRGRQPLGRRAPQPDDRAGDDLGRRHARRAGDVRSCGAASAACSMRWSGSSPHRRRWPVRRPAAAAGSSLPAIVAGRYGRGRTLAMAVPITSPAAEELVQKWGQGDNRYYGKFCRNLVYWLTESSAIGRRRLVASADKRFYRPGETITLQAATYDESVGAHPQLPRGGDGRAAQRVGAESESDGSPLRWPAGLTRKSGEEGPFIVWGEEFELPRGGQDQPLHSIQLPLVESLPSGASSQSFRLELTAYEDQTQVDSTSLDIQILHDPFEQQNPFPNHELLKNVAAASGGQVLRSAEDLAAVLAGRAGQRRPARGEAARRCGATGG